MTCLCYCQLMLMLYIGTSLGYSYFCDILLKWSCVCVEGVDGEPKRNVQLALANAERLYEYS